MPAPRGVAMDQYFETAVQSDEIGKFLGAIRDCEIDRYTTLFHTSLKPKVSSYAHRTTSTSKQTF